MAMKPPSKAIRRSPYLIRKLSRSGNTRYLSLGAVLPQSWEVVKVSVDKLEDRVCILRLEQLQ